MQKLLNVHTHTHTLAPPVGSSVYCPASRTPCYVHYKNGLCIVHPNICAANRRHTHCHVVKPFQTKEPTEVFMQVVWKTSPATALHNFAAMVSCSWRGRLFQACQMSLPDNFRRPFRLEVYRGSCKRNQKVGAYANHNATNFKEGRMWFDSIFIFLCSLCTYHILTLPPYKQLKKRRQACPTKYRGRKESHGRGKVKNK